MTNYEKTRARITALEKKKKTIAQEVAKEKAKLRAFEQRKRQKLFAEIAKLMTELGLHTIDLPSLVGGFLWLSDMMNDAQTRIQMKQKGEEYLSKSH